MMDKKFSECNFYIKGPECGPDDCIHMSVLMGNIQEAAEVGAADCGFDTADINSKGACWIVLRNRIHIIRLPKWRENIKIRTWHTGIDKFYYGREYEIYDEDDNRIAFASSLWIIADIESHKPIIPGKTPGFNISESQNDIKVFGENCPKLTSKIIENSNLVMAKYADYSELDHNHHVNNSRYLAWIYDVLHKENIDTSLVNEVSINYLNEVKDSEKVDLFIISKDTGHYIVQGVKNDNELVFTSEIIVGV